MTDITSLAKPIKLLVLDIDGVCTDGKLYFDEHAESIKGFNCLDGLGIRLMQKAGIEVAIITARTSPPVMTRMKALGVKHIYHGNEDKQSAYEDLLKQLNLTEKAVAYVGDDLPDLTLIRRSGFGISVANGNEFVQSHADYVTKKRGGEGAVREVCELILQAQNKLKAIQEAYL